MKKFKFFIKKEMESNEHIKNNNSFQLNSIKNYSSPLNKTSPPGFFDIVNNNNKSNLGESSLAQYINDSIYDEIKYQYETKEKLNELRKKYLPNSKKKTNYNYSINIIHNMTYFKDNKNNRNIGYSTYTDYYNSPKVSTEKIDYYKTQKENSKIIQNSLLGNKEDNNEIININKSIKLNNEILRDSNIQLNKPNNNLNNMNISSNDNTNIENKTYLNDYLKDENKRLKIMNKNYELLIIPLIEYINDINFHFGINTIDYHILNQVINHKDLFNDNKPLNDLKLLFKYNKNNIIGSNKNDIYQKNKTLNKKDFINSNKINSIKKTYTFDIKEKKMDNDNYKPVIFDKQNNNFENNIIKYSDLGSIKRARTVKERLPKTFWSQNKIVRFKD